MFDFEALPQVVAIVGSREFTRLPWVQAFVERLKPNTIVVSGGARGVDTTAEISTLKRKREKNDICFKPFPVEDFEWELLGKGVGHLRNELLVRWVKFFNGTVIIFAVLDSQGKLQGGSKNVKEWCEKLSVDNVVFSITEQENERMRVLRGRTT